MSLKSWEVFRLDNLFFIFQKNNKGANWNLINNSITQEQYTIRINFRTRQCITAVIITWDKWQVIIPMTLRHTLQPLIWSKVLLPLEKRCISVVVSNRYFWGFVHLKHWNVSMNIFKSEFLILRNLQFLRLNVRNHSGDHIFHRKMSFKIKSLKVLWKCHLKLGFRLCQKSSDVDGCHSQSRYNRVFLSPISNMDIQFWNIWAAQGCFFHVGSK